MDDLITYMGYEWVQSDDDGLITIGINEDGLDEFSEIMSANLPSEGEEVSGDEVCGELETDQGPMNIYSPISGSIVEINEAVVENPDLILEDCYGDGWLVRIEADRPEDIERLARAGSSADEDDDGDEE
ncbi:MAG: glycine cleavage system protein H [Bdellovibrionaceae bacterium]|nr:glycine cleavage system protein H [Bdellovibrionales bacterium]MCB9086220.1 glycine cleavage system protein H [Pseudobdellovibrionaceae bacterium]